MSDDLITALLAAGAARGSLLDLIAAASELGDAALDQYLAATRDALGDALDRMQTIYDETMGARG